MAAYCLLATVTALLILALLNGVKARKEKPFEIPKVKEN